MLPIHHKIYFVPFVRFLTISEIVDLIVYFEMSKETESEKDGDFGSVDLPFGIPLVAHGLFGSLTEEPEIAGFFVLFIGFTIETDMLRFLLFK